MSLFQVQGLAKWSGQGSVEEASKQEDAAAKEVREDGERPLLLVVQELTSEVARYKEKWSAVVVCCSRYKEKCLLIDPRQKYGQILRSRKQLPVTYKNDYVRLYKPDKPQLLYFCKPSHSDFIAISGTNTHSGSSQ
ncbi:hypothetical protein Tco_0747518 [Tanacetum coccineum]|uniref:Uncharacterized protein n=1 Tax=Tanacetum coccineum TaxID=301880 RepID=A0ABQ4YVP8_9ASTR